MNCQRCYRHRAVARVTSEVLNIAVCVDCVLEAAKLIGPKPSDLKIFGDVPEEELSAEYPRSFINAH